jgi:hypothetical protein
MYHVANELTKEPAVLVTENVGERPQEGMIGSGGARVEAPHQASILYEE